MVQNGFMGKYMIKCEVVVDKDEMEVNGHLISNIGGLQQDVYFIVNNDLEFDWLEEAIKYCLEN